MRNENPEPKLGFTVTDPTDEALLKIFKDISAKEIKLLWVILSSDVKAIHARIKSIAERRFGGPSSLRTLGMLSNKV